MTDLRAELDAERAAHGGASPRAIDLACQLACQLGHTIEEDATRTVLDQLTTDLAAEPELAIATHQRLAVAFREQYDLRWTCDQLRRIAVLVERDTARWLDTTVDLYRWLIDTIEDDEAAALLDEIVGRTEHDRALACLTRLRLGRGLVENADQKNALEHLRAALELAPDDRLRVQVAVDLADVMRHLDQHNDMARLVESVLPSADALADGADATADDRDRAAQLHLVLARHGGSEEHARRAWDLTSSSSDSALRCLAAVARGTALEARDALVEAEAHLTGVLAAAGHDTENDAPVRALLDHVQRRRGTRPEEPPPHELVELQPSTEPDRASEARRTFFKPFTDACAQLREHGVVSDCLPLEWSYGPVKTAGDLDSQKIFGPVRSYFCECGRYRGNTYAGVVCELCLVEVITSAPRSTRVGHIWLPSPIVHPWYLASVATLLDTTQKAVKQEEPKVLKERLCDLYIDGLADDLQFRPGPRLDIATALRDTNTVPDKLLLEIIPVLPPDGDHGVPRDKLRTAYTRILGGDEPNRAVAALFRCFEG